MAAAAVDDDEDDGHHSGAVIMVDTGVLNDGLPKWQSNVHDVSSTQPQVHFSLLRDSDLLLLPSLIWIRYSTLST